MHQRGRIYNVEETSKHVQVLELEKIPDEHSKRPRGQRPRCQFELQVYQIKRLKAALITTETTGEGSDCQGR